MITLCELFESSHKDLVSLFETPLKISPLDFDPNKLNSFSGTYLFTIGVKEVARKIGTFEKFDIYEYTVGDYTIITLVNGDYTEAFFMYQLNDNKIILHKMWEWILGCGLCEYFINSYILNNITKSIDYTSLTDYRLFFK